jgi:hypothetical protein
MIYVALCGIFALSFLLWWEKRDRAEERREWEAERSALLLRIQAPELAPTIGAPEPSDEPLYVSPDSDEAWSDYAEERKAGKVN